MEATLRGIGAVDGVVVGKIYIYEAYRPSVTAAVSEDHEHELQRYEEARAKAEQELLSIQDSLMEEDPDKAAIFAAHVDILTDEEIEEQIREGIQESSYTAEYAAYSVYGEFAKMFEEMDDPLLRERKADVEDVSARLLRILEGVEEKNLYQLPGPVVVVARDLFPSDTATIDRANVLAMVTELGNVTSHTAIIARNYNIPAVLGVSDLMTTVKDGMTVAVDAGAGELYLEPDEAVLEAIRERKAHVESEQLLDQAYREKPLITADGAQIMIGANIGAPSDELAEQAKNVDFVGLFRTEFLYMENTHLPTEEEQFEAYKSVLQAFGEKPVTLRTIDIGGDKSVPYMQLPKEENPFLGVRALRLCAEQPELLETQLRAALRASVYGTLHIMFPMVTCLEDVRWAKAKVREVGEALDREGIPWDRDVSLGIMMEVPSIMMIADQVAQEVDFASVGANDLCQYLMASDRLNPNVSRYYQSLHPANFRLIGYAVEQFKKWDKPVSVCGELGGNPLGAPVLAGLGIEKLSMSALSVGKIKRELSDMTMEEMKALAQRVLACGTEEEVRTIVTEAIKKQ